MFASASRSVLGFAFMDSKEPPNRAGGGGSTLEAVRPRRDHRSQSGEAWLWRRCRAGGGDRLGGLDVRAGRHRAGRRDVTEVDDGASAVG